MLNFQVGEQEHFHMPPHQATNSTSTEVPLFWTSSYISVDLYPLIVFVISWLSSE